MSLNGSNPDAEKFALKAGNIDLVIGKSDLDVYDGNGFLVLEDFVDVDDCDDLRNRAEELVQEFEPAGSVSLFSTHEQSRVVDDYFLTSGDKIRFFFEENAFNSDGTLKQAKARSINKIGHALHDLDPVFDKFSRSDKIKQLAEDLRHQAAAVAAIDVYLQATKHRRRSYLPSGQHVSLHRTNGHRRTLVRVGRCDY